MRRVPRVNVSAEATRDYVRLPLCSSKVFKFLTARAVFLLVLDFFLSLFFFLNWAVAFADLLSGEKEAVLLSGQVRCGTLLQ